MKTFTASQVRALLTPADAADAIEGALRAEMGLSATPPRTVVPVRAGQLLLMPAEVAGYVGVKVASVAPGNPARGLPRIQGTFLLMDAATLTSLAVIDGDTLTALRTAAVSAVAARCLVRKRPARMALFGTGPQALAHLYALREVMTIAEVAVIARDRQRTKDFAAAMAAELAVPVWPGSVDDVADADVVVCATTAREPLFAADAVREGTFVIAVGSHEPDAMELDPALLARAQVVVEDPATARREAGEVVAACAAGLLAPGDLVPLADLVRGDVIPATDRTRVFKSVGMAWEDVVVATRIFENHSAEKQ